MELFVENIEHILGGFISLLELVLEAIAALAVFVGLLKTLQMIVFSRAGNLRRQMSIGKPIAFIKIRLTLGMWLALALEFQLGADILATVIAPNFVSLGQLAGIALIRTFLNYFLNQELEAEYEQQQKFSVQESFKPRN